MKETYSCEDLIQFQPQKSLFFGVDSDGCVFDSMTIKQRIFHTEIINFWSLQETEPDVRRVAEWVSLFSPARGLNRFQLILRIFTELNRFGAAQIDTTALEAFVASGVALSGAELKKRIERTGEAALQTLLNWSNEVSRQIAVIGQMPVFDGVEEGLEALQAVGDLIVVSQTTEDALVREWRHAKLERFVDVIAGAELGSKAESLTRAAVERYPSDCIVMMGDAPGDRQAADAVGCLFFPIIPGKECESWIELRTEAVERLRAGTYRGAYQQDLIERFEAALSPTPPWESTEA